MNEQCMTEDGNGVCIREGTAPSVPLDEFHSFQKRKLPSKNSVKYSAESNQSIILFVTICTARRDPILATKCAFDCIVAAFRRATHWIVGRFVVMPDHIHFFCAPASWPPTNFHKWISFLKSTISRTFPPGASERRHLFQAHCWDTQLRSDDSYAEKWKYVRNNPVRKGLCSSPEDWPYQGELNVLVWHD